MQYFISILWNSIKQQGICESLFHKISQINLPVNAMIIEQHYKKYQILVSKTLQTLFIIHLQKIIDNSFKVSSKFNQMFTKIFICYGNL